jgi:hypothetical protein
VAVAAALVGTVGCGQAGKDAKDGERTVVRGKLVDNGKPFALDASKVPLPKGTHALPPGVTGALEVVFISTDTKEPYQATANADAGTFEVTGTDGKGIKSGRYKIAITARLGPSPETPDYFGGKFTPEKTQILRDIKPGDEITIDISKPQG